MRFTLYLWAFLFSLTVSASAQENANSQFQKALRGGKIGKEVAFSKKGNSLDSLVLVYLGEIKTKQGRRLKILTSRWYWGQRATSRIIVFNGKNQYLGDYYLDMTYDVPGRIEGTSLVFVNNNKGTNCTPGLVTKVNFGNGIPREFLRQCRENAGDICSFAQNL
jgi:hypothetical protein